MPKTTLRPNATTAIGDWTVTGTGSGHEVIDDDPDSPDTADHVGAGSGTITNPATFQLTDSPADLGKGARADLRVYGTCGSHLTSAPTLDVELKKSDDTVLATVSFPEATANSLRNTSAAVSLAAADVTGLKLVQSATGGHDAGQTRRNYASEVDLWYALATDPIYLADPALYWVLDDVDLAYDLSGNGRAGTAGGSVTTGGSTEFPDSNPALTKTTDFDGTDDHFTSSYAPFSNGTVRSFCGWAYRDTNSSWDCLFSSNSGTAGNRVVCVLVGSSQHFRFYPALGAGANYVQWNDAWPGNTEWVHWCLIFDEANDTAELFINGVSKGAGTGAGTGAATAYAASPGNLLVGAQGTSSTNPFDGKMARFAVFTDAPTDQEVLDIANAEIAAGGGLMLMGVG